MAKKQVTARLHLMKVSDVQNAAAGDHSDGGGLLLRVRPESVSWVFRYTAPNGKRREMGLGAVLRDSSKMAGESLHAARNLAHQAREQLRQDVDPIDARDGRRQVEREAAASRKAEAARRALTLARAARDFHRRAVEPIRTPKHAAQWISSLENHIPARLWHKPIADVHAAELLEALASIKPHARARNLSQGQRIAETVQRIRQRLEAVFEDAIFHGHATVNPASAVLRKMRENLHRKKVGQFAALPYTEAPAFMSRLRDMPGTAARCLEFAVLTAARTGEAIGAVWSEFDLGAGVWNVPPERMKASGKDKPEPHTVHLSARALEVLTGQLGQCSHYVFPTPRPDDKPRPLSNMAMLATLGRLDARDRTTVHGLCRATFSTWAYDTAAARPDVIEACLAHREADRIKAAYNRARFTQERKALLAAWADFLQTPGAQVLPFQPRAA